MQFVCENGEEVSFVLGLGVHFGFGGVGPTCDFGLSCQLYCEKFDIILNTYFFSFICIELYDDECLNKFGFHP